MDQMDAQLNVQLLETCLSFKLKEAPAPTESVRVFRHTLPLGSLDNDGSQAQFDSHTFLTDIVVLPDATIHILAPRIKELEDSRAKKRRKLSAAHTQRKILATVKNVPETVAGDLILAASLRKNSSLCATNFFKVTGPQLVYNNQSNTVTLEVTLGLTENAGPLNPSRLGVSALAKLLARALDDVTLADPEPYQASPVDLLRVLTRRPRDAPELQITIPGLLTPLLPFQKESVHWCLRREGKDLAEDGESVVPLDPSIRDIVVTPPLGWREMPTSPGLWINPYTLQTLNREPRAPQLGPDEDLCGKGLLSEEMGLGKTLEMIALILLNPRAPIPESNLISYDPLHGHKIKKVRATLVIVPPVILAQWQNELSSHAPFLKTVVYQGRFAEPRVRVPELSDADVVLVSYAVLSAELHSAVFNPGKHNTRFWSQRTDIDDIRSPLVQVQFWRVILDEVQMIHTGISNAARVARIVPRVHAWGVTGTPVKSSIKDLRGLLLFLDMEPFVENPCWQRMIASPIDFEATMSRIGIRHTKPLVADQLHLPPQKRMLVSLKFSAIERHHYDTLYARFRKSNAPEGSPTGWSGWLVRLRQACCHASLVSTGHRDVAAPILTVDQVLARLVDEAEVAVYGKVRVRMVLQLELGQLLDKADRLDDAIALWHVLETELEDNLKQLSTLLEECLIDASSRQTLVDKLAAEYDAIAEEASDEQIQLLETKLADAEHSLANSQARIKAVRSRKRSLQELLHRTYFFLGTGYFRTNQRLEDTLSDEEKARNTEKETKYYEAADEIRASLLAEAAERFDQLAKKLQRPKLKMLQRSIPNSHVLNPLASRIRDLTSKLLKILLRSLMDTDAIAEDKDAYAESLDDQENAYAILDVLQLLLKDRSVAIIGGTSPPQPKETGVEPWTEFKRDLMADRQELVLLMSQPGLVFEPLLAIMRKLRITSQSPAPGSEHNENELSNELLDLLREEIRDWQRELATMRDVFNVRLEYYKQLQSLSDRVVDMDTGESDIKKLVQDKRQAVNRSEKAILHFESKLRYVRDLEVSVHPELRSTAGVSEARAVSDSVKKEPAEVGINECTICQEMYDLGSLTVCGHRFCTQCITQWWSMKGTCPLCKRRLGARDMIQFRNTIKSESSAAGSQPVQRASTTIARDLSQEIYTQIPNTHYNELARETITRSYGIKIDMIVRHVKLLRAKEQTAQFVIFSQWAHMLKLIHTALNENGLVTASLGDKGGSGAFRTNTDIACFLLHAKSDAAGLTLVNANHVILCEPLLNTALELQAISRVHRIGQTQETTVWLFSIEETVEQAILSLTTRRRVRQLEEMQSRDLLPEDADSSILANSVGKLVDKASGSEVVPEDDLRAVLFHDFGPDQKQSASPQGKNVAVPTTEQS